MGLKRSEQFCAKNGHKMVSLLSTKGQAPAPNGGTPLPFEKYEICCEHCGVSLQQLQSQNKKTSQQRTVTP